ncbi:MAG: Rv1355c family protein [Sphingobacteriaceae bacterium]|nr:MAG: Rv1355c family protein [Sphingobacteriaceae bacterium]
MLKNSSHLYSSSADKFTYTPTFYRLNTDTDKQTFNAFLDGGKVAIIHDEIKGQLQELIKSQNPSIKIKAEDYEALIAAHLNGADINEYGVWVYYPWSRNLVHLLDEDEFVEVRTNRNQYKITRQEQEFLKQKKIGIVGLSVGQSIALTIAMERICGEIRLADFDIAELSNLNRLRTGLHNMGINKTIIAAREILEIDPYIKIKLFHEGLNHKNMDEFFTADGKLDLFIEVCDGLDIKIESRYKARELQIPVVMDTNDKGMLDVERFDLEPNRPVLHGLADGLDPANIKSLTNEEKIPYILKMVGAETISTRLKASMMEVEQSINTWPQLASSVVLGGALTTDVCRRILLDQYHDSGRYYVDLEDLVKDKKTETDSIPSSYIGPAELTREEMIQTVKGFSGKTTSVEVPQSIITEIVKAGIMAPSGGNAQPWKFIYNDKGLFIFHDEHFSYSLLDFNHLGSYVAIGAVVENINIKASSLGFGIDVAYFPIESNNKVVAHIVFNMAEATAANQFLEKGIAIRVTNRDLFAKQPLPKDFYDSIKGAVKTYEGVELHIVDDEQLMKQLGEILATAEMLRIIHPRGHYDTFTNELRWTPEEIMQKADGVDVNSLGASIGELAALKVAADSKAIDFIRDLKGGKAFTKAVNKSVASSSALGFITMPEYSELNFLQGGRALERIWIEANLAGVSFQPVAQLVFLIARLKQGNGADLDDYYRNEIGKLEKLFFNLLPELINKQVVFIFRLSKAGEPKVRSLRRPVESSFVYLK